MVIKASLFLTICLVTCAFCSAQNNNGFIYLQDSTVYIGGDTILLASQTDTILATDPITGDIQYTLDYTGYRSEKYPGKVVVQQVPVLLNGDKVYSMYGKDDIKHLGETKKANRYLAEHLQRKMKRYYKKLHSAGYNADIRNIVVAKDGSVVYYEYLSLQKVDPSKTEVLKTKYIDKINRRAVKLLNSLTMMPATINNQPIAYRLKYYELL